MNWNVYLLECSDQTIYCGITNNLEKRLKVHNKGKASKYTRGRLPVKLLYSKAVSTRSEALKLEYFIKQMDKKNKRVLIQSNEPLAS